MTTGCFHLEVEKKVTFKRFVFIPGLKQHTVQDLESSQESALWEACLMSRVVLRQAGAAGTQQLMCFPAWQGSLCPSAGTGEPPRSCSSAPVLLRVFVFATASSCPQCSPGLDRAFLDHTVDGVRCRASYSWYCISRVRRSRVRSSIRSLEMQTQ